MAKKDTIVVKGEVIDSVRDNFKVKLENGIEITAHPSGKMRMRHIRILTGDKVDVELSVYDLTKGRIRYRYS